MSEARILFEIEHFLKYLAGAGANDPRLVGVMRVVAAISVVAMVIHIVAAAVSITIMMMDSDANAVWAHDYRIRHSRYCKCTNTQGEY